jgi:hypothetical protein
MHSLGRFLCFAVSRPSCQIQFGDQVGVDRSQSGLAARWHRERDLQEVSQGQPNINDIQLHADIIGGIY